MATPPRGRPEAGISTALLYYLFAEQLAPPEEPREDAAPGTPDLAARLVAVSLWRLARDGRLTLAQEESDCDAYWRGGAGLPGLDGLLLGLVRRRPGDSPAVELLLRSLRAPGARSADELVLATVVREGQERGYLASAAGAGSGVAPAALAAQFAELSAAWGAFQRREDALARALWRACRWGLAPGAITLWSPHHALRAVGVAAAALLALLAIAPGRGSSGGPRSALLAIATVGLDPTGLPPTGFLLTLIGTLPALCAAILVAHQLVVWPVYLRLGLTRRALVSLVGGTALVACLFQLAPPGLPAIVTWAYVARVALGCGLACSAVVVFAWQARAIGAAARRRGFIVETAGGPGHAWLLIIAVIVTLLAWRLAVSLG